VDATSRAVLQESLVVTGYPYVGEGKHVDGTDYNSYQKPTSFERIIPVTCNISSRHTNPVLGVMLSKMLVEISRESGKHKNDRYG
jgi:hypothetical protein